MKNIKALLKLDYLLVAPYWLWFVLFFGISFILGVFMNQGFAFMVSWTIFAGTIMAFPFENTEKSNMNMLFAQLPTNRKSIVSARYMFIFIVLFLSLIIGIAGGLILDTIFSNSHAEMYYEFGINLSLFSLPMMLLSLSLSFGLYLLNVGFQTPFLYKVGYKKGKIFMWIPIIVVQAAIMLPAILNLFNVENPNRFNVFNIMIDNSTISTFIALGVGIVSAVLSYIFSRKIYLNKDV